MRSFVSWRPVNLSEGRCSYRCHCSVFVKALSFSEWTWGCDHRAEAGGGTSGEFVWSLLLVCSQERRRHRGESICALSLFRERGLSILLHWTKKFGQLPSEFAEGRLVMRVIRFVDMSLIDLFFFCFFFWQNLYTKYGSAGEIMNIHHDDRWASWCQPCGIPNWQNVFRRRNWIVETAQNHRNVPGGTSCFLVWQTRR